MKNLHRIVRTLTLLAFAGTVDPAPQLQVVRHFFSGISQDNVDIQALLRGEATDNIQNKVNEELGKIDFKPFLREMGNASANSMHGLRTDYISDPKIFVFGTGFAISLNPDEQSLNDFVTREVRAENSQLPRVGIAISASILVGLSLDGLPFIFPNMPDFLKPIDVYINLYSLSLDGIQFLSGSIFNIGLNLQYKLLNFERHFTGAFKWRGVNIGSGFNYQAFSLTSDKIHFSSVSTSTIHEEGTGNAQTLKTTWDGNISLGTSNKIFVIPTDISTGIYAFYFFSCYGGLGADFIFGSSKLAFENSGGITTEVGGSRIHRAESSLTIDESGSPTFFNFRVFLGLQIEVWLFNFFAQGTYEIVNKGYSLSFGARVSY